MLTDAATSQPEGLPSYVIELWKASLETQRHFNDLQMRIRAIALPVVLSASGAAGFIVKEKLRVTILGVSTSLGEWLIVGALFTWLAFYFMDRWWYHRLLLGAVQHSEFIESRWHERYPEIALAQAIRRASPVKALHSSQKIDVFYVSIALLLVFLMIGLQFVVGS